MQCLVAESLEDYHPRAEVYVLVEYGKEFMC